MKKLFAVLLAVAMLLSLSVVAFAGEGEPTTGTITVANAGTATYKAYKIFDARVDSTDNKVHYTVSGALKDAIDAVLAKDESAKSEIEKGLKFIYNDAGEIEADAGFSAADFAAWLLLPANASLLGTAQTLTTADDVATLNDVAPGYYLVVPDPLPENGVGALATVIPGRTTQVQNKNDMPLDKEVERGDTAAGGTDDYDDNGEGVKVGDTLNYKITAKTPASYKSNDFDYTFLITDKMTDGLTFQDDLKIEITKEGKDTITIEPRKDGTVTVKIGDSADNVNGTTFVPRFNVKNSNSTGPMDPNSARFNGKDAENGGNFNFEVSLAVASELLREYTSADVTITYSAKVNDKATAQLLQNTAVLTYGDDNNLTIKDAETDNYISRIVVDKFETGNRTQKLPGAEFILYKQSDLSDPNTKEYYVLSYTTPAQAAQAAVPAVYWEDADYDEWKVLNPDGTGAQFADVVGTVRTPAVEAHDAVPASGASVSWDSTKANATVMTTDANGYAEFPYLEDGTYYLEEIKAPVDYTRLLGPIEIVVDGSASVDGRLTQQQRVDALTNVANVANNPGSTMPSTGGVGATLLTIGGVVLMLAAGAYLVLRKRQEN